MAGSAALTAITVCRDPGSTRVHVWHHCTAVDTCVLGADHVDTVNEGIHTEGAEVDIWGRVGGGLLLPLGDICSWKVTNGDNGFLRNTSPCVPMYTASYFRRLYSY